MSKTFKPGEMLDIMFPSSHDLTPTNIECTSLKIRNLLAAGNTLLLVSKPHLSVISRLCEECAAYRALILFRFTIGSDDDGVLQYWEPNAPLFAERLASLELACKRYRTSISIEPALDLPNVERLIEKLEPHVTDTLWIGLMNRARNNVHPKTKRDVDELAKVLANQTPEQVTILYEKLKAHPKIQWKDSIREIVGLPACGKGTKEWARRSNKNCVLGCSHNCRYCYARQIIFNRTHRTDDWTTEKLLWDKAKKA
jgi:DNA repair photolyase